MGISHIHDQKFVKEACKEWDKEILKSMNRKPQWGVFMKKVAQIDPSLGIKHDKWKTDWSLLPIEGVEEIAKVMTFGAKKYDRFNWMHVPDPMMRYYAAAMRHLTRWRQGYKNDKQSGCSHLAHAGCCLLFLYHFDQQLKKEQRLCRKNNMKSAPTAGEKRKTTRKSVPGVKVTVRSSSNPAFNPQHPTNIG